MQRNRRILLTGLVLAVTVAAGLLLVLSGSPCDGDGEQGLFTPQNGTPSPSVTTSAPTQSPTLAPTSSPSPTATPLPTAVPIVHLDGFRGVWVSSVWNLDYPSRAGLPVKKLEEEAVYILDCAADLGLTAVILQVRPAADALYASDIFPWSDFLSETQGEAPADDFDPLAFWVEEAHARGLELHAWVNPFRVTVTGTRSAPLHDPDALAANHPARLNPSWVFNHTDGNMYFDPGNPEVRRLVVQGVVELVQRYDVDGIHYDDYFYPAPDIDDRRTYETYGASFESLDDWRRDCINRLIRDTYTAIKAIRPDCRFGVSPAGIWANRSLLHPQGSDTLGYEGYTSSHADALLWVKSEWLDYVCPQIYWHVGDTSADFETLLHWWNDATLGTSVDLYIGQAAYRVGEGKYPSHPWYDQTELRRQWALCKQTEAAGVVLFRFGSISSNQSLYASIKQAFSDG